jgi:hypothetical protein
LTNTLFFATIVLLLYLTQKKIMDQNNQPPTPEKTKEQIDAEVAAIMGGNAASAAILDIDPTDTATYDAPDPTDTTKFTPPTLEDYGHMLPAETEEPEVPDVAAMSDADIWAQLGKSTGEPQ